MFKRWQGLDPEKGAALALAAKSAPTADPAVEYPAWYLRRWHSLPDGYLSARSVRHYDRWTRNLYSAFAEASARRRMARQLRDDARTSILEVGCGPGHYLREIARELPGRRIAAVDLSPYMVHLARQRLTDFPDIEVSHADGSELPFAAGEFDAVVMVHLLGHVPPEVGLALVAEAARVARAGARLYVVDHAWHRAVPSGTWRGPAALHLAPGVLRLTVRQH